MNVNGRHYRTIWLNRDGWAVDIIDQTKFPHLFETVTLRTPEEAGVAIKDMLVRGAPAIGMAPNCASLARPSAELMMRLASWLTLSTIAFGVPAGATMANQTEASRSMPSSVATSASDVRLPSSAASRSWYQPLPWYLASST